MIFGLIGIKIRIRSRNKDGLNNNRGLITLGHSQLRDSNLIITLGNRIFNLNIELVKYNTETKRYVRRYVRSIKFCHWNSVGKKLLKMGRSLDTYVRFSFYPIWKIRVMA